MTRCGAVGAHPRIRAQHDPGAPQTPGTSAGRLAEAPTWWEHPRAIHSRPGGRLRPRPEVCPKERDAPGPAEQARRPGAQVARAEGAWQAQRSSENSSRAGRGRREGRCSGRLEALFPPGGGGWEAWPALSTRLHLLGSWGEEP